MTDENPATPPSPLDSVSNAAANAADGGASVSAGPIAMPTSQPVLLRALWLETLVTVVLAVLFGVIGNLVSELPGVIGGALGALMAGILASFTIGSILFANHRFIRSPSFVVIFFAIVAGGWLLKFIVFIVAVVLLRDQTWLDLRILFFAFVAGLIASLVIDALVVAKSRIPIGATKSV